MFGDPGSEEEHGLGSYVASFGEASQPSHDDVPIRPGVGAHGEYRFTAYPRRRDLDFGCLRRGRQTFDPFFARSHE